MATYLKRTSKLFDLTVSRGTADVNLRDLICPICRGILIEPVTLPCTHNLCLRCLKGTFEHNSLSCPLCRVRVGSWLRTATKSETLVNGTLWQLIRERFPKEVEGKHNGDDGDIDPGFPSQKIILSAAGEIRREYEAQLQIAEEEMRRRRETERLANEALIRKIRADEERDALSQLASDRLLAKSFAKKQLLGEGKSLAAYCARREAKNSVPPLRPNGEIDKPSARRALDDKPRTDKIPVPKSSARNALVVPNAAAAASPKHNQAVREQRCDAANFTNEAGCSGTQIYGTRSKEELRVPTDLLSSKKKIIEVHRVTRADNDAERIGSAESAGSHDSINQEIHHFKPIKPIARTSLKISQDGRPIDPKLIRVVPIVVRVSNAVPKAPSPTHLKRLLGCSWSAFRGKARRSLEQHRRLRSSPEVTETARTEEPKALAVTASSSYSTTSSASSSSSSVSSAAQQPQSQPRSSAKTLSKSQGPDASRRLDLASEVSTIDSNKNYAKSINRILNGTTKVSKKLILGAEDDDDDEEDDGVELTSREVPLSGKATRSKAQTLFHRPCEKSLEIRNDDDEEDDDDDAEEEEEEEDDDDDDDDKATIAENIAERIKRRKCHESSSSTAKSTVAFYPSPPPIQPEVTSPCVDTRKTRRRKILRKPENITISSTTTTTTRTKNISRTEDKNLRAKKHPSKRRKIVDTFLETNETEKPNENAGTAGSLSVEATTSDLDRRAIEEQSRIESLIAQEKKDFELATRLQAHYDDMERIAGRTRGGSRRAMENNMAAANAPPSACRFLELKATIDRHHHHHPHQHHHHRRRTGSNAADNAAPVGGDPTRNRKQRGKPQKQAVK